MNLLTFLIYFLSVLVISFLISLFFRNRRWFVFFLFLMVFITPSKVDSTSEQWGPSVFVFFYDLIFETTFSTLSLRPLVLSLSTFFVSYFIFSKVKKRFFQKINP